MAVNGVNQQLSAMIERFAYVRTGIVTAVDPFGVSVTVGETNIRAAYIRQAEPEIGDVVAVVRQGATWFVLGTSSASGVNLVENPSFETVRDDGTPDAWFQFIVAGTPVWSSEPDDRAVDGERVLEVFTPGAVASTSLVYSGPIAVTVGQTLEVSAYRNGFYPADNPNTTDIQLRVLWFANATDLYPTTSVADSTLVTLSNIPEDDTMTVIQGTVVVPVGAVFARVGLRTAMLTGTGAHWDFVGLRVTG